MNRKLKHAPSSVAKQEQFPNDVNAAAETPHQHSSAIKLQAPKKPPVSDRINLQFVQNKGGYALPPYTVSVPYMNNAQGNAGFAPSHYRSLMTQADLVESVDKLSSKMGQSSDSSVNTPPKQTEPQSDASGKFFKLLRATIGAGIIVTVLSSILVPQVIPVSGNSIVNTRLYWVRTPIQGDLRFKAFEVGSSVVEGQILGTVFNERADDGFLNQLKIDQSTVQASLLVLKNKKSQLIESKIQLQRTLGQSLKQEESESDILLSETHAELNLLYAEVEEVDERIRRYEKANDDYSTEEKYAIVSRAMLEEHYSMRKELKTKIAKQFNVIEVKKREAQAIESDNSALAASIPEQQRLIDIGQKILDVESDINSLTLKSGQLVSDIEKRNLHLKANQRHDLKSKVTGKVWDTAFVDESYVNAGDSIIAVTDTSSVVIEGYFHQRYLDNIEIGDHAMVNLMGSESKLTGKVVEIKIRDQIKPNDLSAFDFRNPATNEFKVVVELAADQAQIPQVGQRAKLIISKSPKSLLPHVLTLFNR